MWRYKTNFKGDRCKAVVRRMKIVGDLDLSEKENRVTFGYCYLEWSKV